MDLKRIDKYYADSSNAYFGDRADYVIPDSWTPTWDWEKGCYFTNAPSPNPTEQAYNILKVLVEKKIISTPKSFTKFCELVDAIKEALKS